MDPDELEARIQQRIDIQRLASINRVVDHARFQAKYNGDSEQLDMLERVASWQGVPESSYLTMLRASLAENRVV
jgi:hypothetical protein